MSIRGSSAANDRATMLNLMVGLNGYTLCSGIICEELNGNEFCGGSLSGRRGKPQQRYGDRLHCQGKYDPQQNGEMYLDALKRYLDIRE